MGRTLFLSGTLPIRLTIPLSASPERAQLKRGITFPISIRLQFTLHSVGDRCVPVGVAPRRERAPLKRPTHLGESDSEGAKAIHDFCA